MLQASEILLEGVVLAVVWAFSLFVPCRSLLVVGFLFLLEVQAITRNCGQYPQCEAGYKREGNSCVCGEYSSE